MVVRVFEYKFWAATFSSFPSFFLKHGVRELEDVGGNC